MASIDRRGHLAWLLKTDGSQESSNDLSAAGNMVRGHTKQLRGKQG